MTACAYRCTPSACSAARKWVLRDLTLDVAPGGALGAARRERCGQDAAPEAPRGRCVADAHRPRVARAYRLGRREVDLIEAKSRIAYLGAEMQDKYARYGWDLTVSDLIATGLHRTDLLLSPVTPSERRKIEATLRACGLKRLAGRRLSSLSYGQKRLALLARALCPRPGLAAARRALQRSRRELSPTHRSRAARGARARRLLDRRGAPRLRRAARHARPHRARCRKAPRHAAAAARRRRRDCARRPASARAGARGRAGRGAQRVARRARAAARGAPLVKISGADLYVDYQPVLRGRELGAARGRALGGVRGERGGQEQFLEALVRRSVARARRRHRAPRISAGDADRRLEAPVGFVSPELQTDYAVNVSVRDLVASGPRASIGLAEPTTAAEARVAARWLRFFGLSGVGRAASARAVLRAAAARPARARARGRAAPAVAR